MPGLLTYYAKFCLQKVGETCTANEDYCSKIRNVGRWEAPQTVIASADDRRLGGSFARCHPCSLTRPSAAA